MHETIKVSIKIFLSIILILYLYFLLADFIIGYADESENGIYSINHEYNIAVLHGLCRPYISMNSIMEYLDYNASNISLKYHGRIRDLKEINNEKIEEQVTDICNQLSRTHDAAYIIAYSYSAAILMKLSISAKIPSNIKLILICPAVFIKSQFLLKILTTFPFNYFIPFRWKFVQSILQLFSGQNKQIFWNKNIFFSRRGILASLALSKYIQKHGGDMKNDYSLILSELDEQVDINLILNSFADSEKCKYCEIIANAKHTPYLSKNKSVKTCFYKALNKALKI